GDTAARRTRCTDLHALDGDGNVCRRKLLMPNDQTATSKKSPHTAKLHAKRSQRGSRLSGRFLQSAAGLHQKCGRAQRLTHPKQWSGLPPTPGGRRLEPMAVQLPTVEVERRPLVFYDLVAGVTSR